MLWRMIHRIQFEADSLLGEGRGQIIIPSLFSVDVMEVITALGQHEPANWLVDPERW
jgi:hypothetical protein